MTIDHTTRLFFDASCLIAAAGSPQGGSGFLLALCGRELLRGAISHHVLREAEHNIQTKLPPPALDHFYEQVRVLPFLIAPVPVLDEPAAWHLHVNAKDRHVIAAALAIRAAYLLTLDQNLILETNRAALPILALTPGDFIRIYLPTHDEYPRLR